MDIRIPHFDGQKDFLAFINFLDNREEYERYMATLDKKIAKFTEATASYGKAKDINRLHEEAELLALRAQGAFTEREKKLEAGEVAFKKSMAEQTKALADKESVMQQRLNTKGAALRDRQVALQGREVAVGEREATAQEMHNAAMETKQAAQEVKREADDMVARMKAAMPHG